MKGTFWKVDLKKNMFDGNMYDSPKARVADSRRIDFSESREILVKTSSRERRALTRQHKRVKTNSNMEHICM